MNLNQVRDRRGDILRIAGRHGVTNVQVFGSVARGDARADSDIDLLVDVASDRRGFEYFGVLEDVSAELEVLLGCHVDVLSIREVTPHIRAEAERIRTEAVAL
jgi:uncharacterized protein